MKFKFVISIPLAFSTEDDKKKHCVSNEGLLKYTFIFPNNDHLTINFDCLCQ